MKTFRNPVGAHAPVADYTHQVEISADERMLIMSGQIGVNENGSMSEDPLEQLEAALENVLLNL